MRIPKIPRFPYTMTENHERAEVAAGRVGRINRHLLPYGAWVCFDGREVLFDRQYKPLLERPACGAPAVLADGDEWVKEIKSQSWFYSDEGPERKKREKAIAALKMWGVVA